MIDFFCKKLLGGVLLAFLLGLNIASASVNISDTLVKHISNEKTGFDELDTNIKTYSKEDVFCGEVKDDKLIKCFRLYTDKNQTQPLNGVYKDGHFTVEIKDGYRHGKYVAKRTDGSIRLVANYKDGLLDGTAKLWYHDGRLRVHSTWKDNNLVEPPALFTPAGDRALTFLNKKQNYLLHSELSLELTPSVLDGNNNIVEIEVPENTSIDSNGLLNIKPISRKNSLVLHNKKKFTGTFKFVSSNSEVVAIDQYVSGKRHGVYIVIGKTRSEWVKGVNIGINTYKAEELDESNKHYNKNLKDIYLDVDRAKERRYGKIAFVRMNVKKSKIHGEIEVFRIFEESKRRNYLYKSALKEYKNGLKHGFQLYWAKKGYFPKICGDAYVHSYAEPGMYIENENDTYINYAELCGLADPKNFYEFPEHLMFDFSSSSVLPPYFKDYNVNKIRKDVDSSTLVRARSGNPMDMDVADFKAQYQGGMLYKLESYNKDVMTYAEKYLNYTSESVKSILKKRELKQGSLINIVGDYSKKTINNSTNILSYRDDDLPRGQPYFNNDYPELVANRVMLTKTNKRRLECNLVELTKDVALCEQDVRDYTSRDAAFIFSAPSVDESDNMKKIETRLSYVTAFYNNLVERDLPKYIGEMSFNDNIRRYINILSYYYDPSVNDKDIKNSSPIKLLENQKENKYQVRHNKEAKDKVSSICTRVESNALTSYKKIEKGRLSIDGLQYTQITFDGIDYSYRKDHSREDDKLNINSLSALVDGKYKKVKDVSFGKLGCTIENIKEKEKINFIVDDDTFMNDMFDDN